MSLHSNLRFFFALCSLYYSSDPAYLSILPPGTPPITDTYEFLDSLAKRLSMLKRGGGRDVERAAVWFIRWWREEGCALSASAPFLASDQDVSDSEENTFSHAAVPPRISPSESSSSSFSTRLHGNGPGVSSQVQRGGWGFDFQWELQPMELDALRPGGHESTSAGSLVQRKMEEVVDKYVEMAEAETQEGGDVSATQVKKQEKALQKAKRERRVRELLARRRGG